MFEWFVKTRIIQGKGTINRMKAEIARAGGSHAVIITDAGIAGTGIPEKSAKALGDLCAGIFSDVPQDTGFDTVNKAAELARQNAADCVVAIGGGSVIDTAKAVAIVLKEGGRAEDHAGFYVLKKAGAPLIVVPTTAGTGSEVTSVAIVFDRANGRKAYFISEFIAPAVAILDPAVTIGLPSAITAATGMDALTHAVEAATSKGKNEIASALAYGAIESIRANLPQCVNNGSDLKARARMQIAATMAGMAFASAQVGLAHAISHSIGAVARVPHGVANGIILPAVMRFNAPDCASEMARVAIALGVEKTGRHELELALAAADEVEKLLNETGHPTKLSQAGVTENDIDRIATLSMTDPAILTTPKMPASKDRVIELIKSRF